MTTIHLTDVQRDTFAACGLIVIDGDICPTCHGYPEGWRILTVKCDGSGSCPAGIHLIGCWKSTLADEANEFFEGLPVVTLTATCPTCGGAGSVYPAPYAPGMEGDPCDICDQGVVSLGRFTIPALLPVYLSDDLPENYLDMIEVNPSGEVWLHSLAPLERHGYILDPLPRPGQFIARPEKVA